MHKFFVETSHNFRPARTHLWMYERVAPFWTFEGTKVCTTHKPNAVGTLCDRDNTTLCERSNETARSRCERMKRVECKWRQETQRVNKNHFICCARCSMPSYVVCVCAWVVVPVRVVVRYAREKDTNSNG